MKQLKFIAVFVLALVAVFQAKSQSLDQQASELLKTRIQHHVNLMNDNISFMADPQKKVSTRQRFRTKALALVLAKGEGFQTDTGYNRGVTMEVSSLAVKTPKKRLMRQYFANLIRLNYSKVVITSTAAHDIKVSDLKHVGGNQYVCTATYEQVFEGFSRDGRLRMGDRTRKNVTVHVQLDDTADGYEFIIRLGDTKVVETRSSRS